MKQYNHKEIEKKWQKKWGKQELYKTEEISAKPKCYVLDMFPYPSGEGLHVGHPKGYIATDVYSRFKKMSGFNVLHPMGWDAFGLPAEQYAIKNKIHPRVAVEKNVARFKEQLSVIGFNYDWERELSTTDPKFYKWTQWIFLKLFEKGLAYESYEPINWCPSCQTGLANEDLDGNRCERCGTVVEKKPMRQWCLRITDYAERLLADLDALEWPESIKESQKNWIGKSEGAIIRFQIVKDNIPPAEWHGTGILIKTKSGKYLFQERDMNASRHPGMFTPFGGGRENRESPLLCAIREIKEEIDIELSVAKIQFVGDFGSRNNPGKFHKVFYAEDIDVNTITVHEGKGAVELTYEEALAHPKVTEFTKNALRKWETMEKHAVDVFTTRPDTLFGATFLAISAELAQKWIDVGWAPSEDIKKYIADTIAENATRTYEEKEKTGIFSGVQAINPANGEEIPVWVVNYVLGDVGTGAIMAVPAHDERDFEFAKKFDLPVRQVIAPIITLTGASAPQEDKPITQRNVTTAIIRRKGTNNYLLLSWGKDGCGFVGGGIDEGETPEEAIKREIMEETGYVNFDIQEIQLMSLYGHGFKHRKDVNCFDRDKAFLVEILDDAQNEISEKEKSEHNLTWIDLPDVFPRISLDHHKYIWERYQAGEQPFTEEGKLVNSDQFDGLTSEEAKKAITEFVGGKMKTTYKLRDWVFSRQRYWGEPIPIIHCEACKNKKQKVLLVHGFKGGADKNSLPYLKKELEAKGFEVFAPTMTTSAEPDFEQWMEELRPYFEKLSEDDIVVGFSLGGKAAVSALERFQKKIGHLYLIAPAIEAPKAEYWEKRKTKQPELTGALDKVKVFWEMPIDWAKVEGLPKSAEVLWSGDDISVLEPTNAWCPKSWQIKKMIGFQHFTAPVIPELLEEILRAKNTGAIPVPEKDLPVKLPEVEFYEPSGTGESPLANISDWVSVKCPKCGGEAKRETNTMPQWAGSSWYYLRFIDPKNSEALVDKNKEKYWSPVDMYVGGAEHATRHLIYARFWHKFLYDIGAVNYAEPFLKLHNVGLILAEDGRKMSKRWGNVVNPDDIVEEFGADTLRLYEMFMGPFEQATAWSTDGIVGPRRFLEKVFRLSQGIRNQESGIMNPALETLLHQTVKKVTEDIEAFKFNTAISALMIFANALEKEESVPLIPYSLFLILLAPFAPHITEELWHEIGNESSIYLAEWPKYDEAKTRSDHVTIAVQVNGKLRGTFDADAGISEDEAAMEALSLPDVKKWLEGKKPKKVIYVKGKLVSIVV